MAFELSTVPPPDVIETLEYDAILTELVNQFRSLNPNYTSIVEGDPAYTLLEAMAYVEVMLRKRINDAARAVLITHAVGADLDNLGALFGVQRLVLQVAAPDADPPTPEILETDTSYRRRIMTILETVANGSIAWYKKHTLDANTAKLADKTPVLADTDKKVKDVAVFRGATGGVVKVYVQSADPDEVIPTARVTTQVQKYLNEDSRRFLCDTVEVAAVAKKTYNLTATLVVSPGFTSAAVIAETQKRADAFVKAREIIGQEIPLSHIYAALIWEGVAELTLTAPTTNVIPKAGGVVSNADQVPEVPVADTVSIT